MNSRKGFEIAINTLVVMILGILVVVGGIVIVTRLMKSASGFEGTLTASQQNHLREQLTNGQLVAVYPLSLTVASGKSASVGLGVENRLGGDSTTFSVAVTDETKTKLSWVRAAPTLDVKNNQQAQAIIVVEPPKTQPAGIYTILVNVSVAGETYDAVRAFTVRVE